MELELVGYDGDLIGWGHKDFHHLFGQSFNPGFSYHQRGHVPQLVRFSNYNDLVEYHCYLHSNLGRANSVTIPVHELAGLIQNLRPVQNAITEWMDALKKAKADYGFGCLHDGDGNMDPLGVLADTNGCEWVWDRREGAYKIKGGDAYTLPDKVLRSYLGVPDDVSERHVKDFQTTFPGMMDRCTTYQQVIDMLRNALDLIAFRLNDIRSWRNHGGPLRVGDLGSEEQTMYQTVRMPSFGRDSIHDYAVMRRGVISLSGDWP
jgi:hypothetical protein